MGASYAQMKTISRRQFMQVASATILAVVAVPAIGSGHGNGHHGQKHVRVRPLSSEGNLRPAERAFYRRARFETAADAMRAAASRGMTVEIYME